jgi:hypothetical protein
MQNADTCVLSYAADLHCYAVQYFQSDQRGDQYVHVKVNTHTRFHYDNYMMQMHATVLSIYVYIRHCHRTACAFVLSSCVSRCTTC